MAEKSDGTTSPSPAAERKARLAEALRENLHRRKAQSRARTATGTVRSRGTGDAPEDAGADDVRAEDNGAEDNGAEDDGADTAPGHEGGAA